jgi:TolA protein
MKLKRMKRITPYCLLGLLFTFACSSDAHETHSSNNIPLGDSVPMKGNMKDYALDIKSAIQMKFFLKDDYIGKECHFRLKLSKEGVIGDILQAKGYQPLCEAAKNAIRNAYIPPAPDNETYEVFKEFEMHFTPQ